LLSFGLSLLYRSLIIALIIVTSRLIHAFYAEEIIARRGLKRNRLITMGVVYALALILVSLTGNFYLFGVTACVFPLCCSWNWARYVIPLGLVGVVSYLP
jgi:hypothetical protein